MPYGMTVLSATQQRWHSRLYASKFKLVLNLATPKGCKAELSSANSAYCLSRSSWSLRVSGSISSRLSRLMESGGMSCIWTLGECCRCRRFSWMNCRRVSKYCHRKHPDKIQRHLKFLRNFWNQWCKVNGVQQFAASLLLWKLACNMGSQCYLQPNSGDIPTFTPAN